MYVSVGMYVAVSRVMQKTPLKRERECVWLYMCVHVCVCVSVSAQIQLETQGHTDSGDTERGTKTERETGRV